MTRLRCKEKAESLLRELPPVLGAHVSEDIRGQPREVHLLVAPGPDVRELARDVRMLLEERLAIPVDQRIISIAQLSARATGDTRPALSEDGGEACGSEHDVVARRIVFHGIESRRDSGLIHVRVWLTYAGEGFDAEASEPDSEHGAVRAAAAATVAALGLACGHSIRLQLDTGSLVRAFERPHALVAVLAGSAHLGRSRLLLTGTHPAGEDIESAGALATLKATNRLLELGLAGVLDRSAPTADQLCSDIPQE